jgi:hypothetical protein
VAAVNRSVVGLECIGVDQSRRSPQDNREFAARSQYRFHERAFYNISPDTRTGGSGSQIEIVELTPGLVGGHCIEVDAYYLPGPA